MQEINIINKEKQNSAKFYIAELTIQRDQPELITQKLNRKKKIAKQRIVLNLHCADLTVFLVELIQSQQSPTKKNHDFK